MTKSYSELCKISDYLERFKYLKLNGYVGRETFGHNRYLNQKFYTSEEWRHFRRDIILRDNGCDLGCDGYDINGSTPIMIHHINPITVDDILQCRSSLMDPDNVIICTPITHNAIHYGDHTLLNTGPTARTPYDTCPWRKERV